MFSPGTVSVQAVAEGTVLAGILCAEVFKLAWNASSPHVLASVFPLSSLKSLESLCSLPRPVLLTWVICLSLNSGNLVLTFPEESAVSCQPSSLPVCGVAQGRGCGTRCGVPASPGPVLADISDSLKNQGHFLPETQQDWFLGQRPHLKLASIFPVFTRMLMAWTQFWFSKQ